MAEKTKEVGVMTVMEAIKQCSRADLDAIRESIKTHEDELASLRLVEKIIDVKLNGRPVSPLKGKKRGATAAGGPALARTGTLTEKYRRDVARLLLAGPKRQAIIAEECGIPSGSIGGVLDHPWFEKNLNGTVMITVKGRQENAA